MQYRTARWWAGAVTMAIVPLASAAPRDEFPQFRGMSALPGSMLPVNSQGRFDSRGAMSISTPLAYPVAANQFAIGVSVLSRDRRFRYETKSGGGVERGNGTGQFITGLPVGPNVDVTASYMVLSSIGDGAFHLVVSPQFADARWRVAFGIQDIGGGGGAMGVGHPDQGRTSRSFFAVTTGEITDRIHASVGTGTRRFEGLFASTSVAIAPRWNAAVEFDTYGWNVGVAHTFDLGRPSSRPAPKAALFAGIVGGKKAVWGVSVGF